MRTSQREVQNTKNGSLSSSEERALVNAVARQKRELAERFARVEMLLGNNVRNAEPKTEPQLQLQLQLDLEPVRPEPEPAE